MIKVYVKTDGEGYVTDINSDIFLSDISGYTQIDEGDGDKYRHAQNHYLENEINDIDGKYNYRLVDGAVISSVD